MRIYVPKHQVYAQITAEEGVPRAEFIVHIGNTVYALNASQKYKAVHGDREKLVLELRAAGCSIREAVGLVEAYREVMVGA